MCLATATHSFKWMEITIICLIWDQKCADVDVWTPILFPITVIESAIKWIKNDYSRA